MYIKEKSGPRIEPWGTPQLILSQLEELLLYVNFLYLLVK